MRRALVDGVRVVWDDLPGQYQAAFVVGCGARDEDLDQLGLTSLVLDLALDAVDSDEDDSATDWMATLVARSGLPDEVAAYFADCCAALADPPEEDLDDLFGSSAGCRDPWASLLSRRLGRFGPGLLRWPNVDRRKFTADEVRAHVARYFTAGNTVLALSGPPPEGLRLPLPPGPAVARPDPPDLRWRRGWYTDEVDGVGVAINGTVGAPALALQLVLAERVAAALLRDGLEYRVTPMWTPLDRDHVDFGLTLQPPDEYSKPAHATVARLLWQELRRLASATPDRGEIEDALGDVEPEPMDSDDEDILLDQVSDRLYGAAQRELFGVSDDVADLATAEVSPGDVLSAAASCLATATMVVPAGTDVDLAGMSRTRCPVSTFVPAGVVLEPLSRSFRRRLHKAGAAERLILGDDGVCLVAADGSVHTFPMADLLVIEDGELVMLGNVAHGCLVNISAFGGRSMLADRLPVRRYRGRRR